MRNLFYALVAYMMVFIAPIGLSPVVLESATARTDDKHMYRHSLAASSYTLDGTGSFELENTQDSVWGLMLVYLTLTDANNSTTAVNMVCTGSEDNNTTDWNIVNCVTGTTSTTCYAPFTWTIDPSAIASPKRWVYRVDIEGFQDVECSFTDTGGVAADTLAWTVSLAIKE